MNKTQTKIAKLEIKLGKTENPKAKQDINVRITHLRKRLAKNCD